MTLPEVTIEARGVLCPVPIIRLARTARALPPGTMIELLTDDPAAAYDVPAWCRLRGHELLATVPAGAAAELGQFPTPARVPTGPEPDAPNGSPGQALRHLIRLGSRPATA